MGVKYCQDFAVLKIIAWDYKYRNSQDPIFISFSFERTSHVFHSERQVGVGSFSEARGAGLIFLEDLFPLVGSEDPSKREHPPPTHTHKHSPSVFSQQALKDLVTGYNYWGFSKFSVHENHLRHLFKMLIPGVYLQIC